MKTAARTSEIPISAGVISVIDRIVASRGEMVLAHHALDVFDDHDGIVDQKTDGKDQPEHGERVDGIAHRRENAECAEQDHRNRDCRDQRRAPVLQEDIHDHHDEDDRLDQCLDHFHDRDLDENAAVAGIDDPVAGRHVAREFGNAGLDRFGRGHRIRARGQRDGKTDGGIAVELADRGVVFLSQFDPRDFLEQDARPVHLGLEHDIAELLAGLEPRARGDRGVEALCRGEGVMPTSPAEICAFCAVSALITSWGISLTAASRVGSSQMRMAYWVP
jgi:hypothetical protein